MHPLWLLVLCSYGSLALVSASGLSASILQSQCGTLYTVVSGDGCFAISGVAHITQAQLAALNPDLNCATLAPGQGLCLSAPCSKTYEVQSGDWCAKIQDEQGISADDLLSLNSGFSCDELFPAQRLCIAPPLPATTTAAISTPTSLPTQTPEPLPVVPCKTQVGVAQGDTCSGLASGYSIQLGQFLAMNANINCDNLQPGAVACVLPACGEVYRVQSGDWCAKIEEDHGLASGQLVQLNPALSCPDLAPDQLVCVESPPVAEPADPIPPTFKAWSQFPALSPGGPLTQSPLLTFFNADDPRDTVIGKTLFQPSVNVHNCGYERRRLFGRH
ncbi:hypothetical protein FB451DRAFT_183013 [Mycena latifolia]|nr:hypothetical protein FB451DRAFT_183013 [Mycena latifolia]